MFSLRIQSLPLAVEYLSIVGVSHLLLYWGSWMGFRGSVWWIYFHFPLRSSFQTSVYILLIFIAYVSIISCRRILITGVYSVSVF
jgi:hypothetical protein